MAKKANNYYKSFNSSLSDKSENRNAGKFAALFISLRTFYETRQSSKNIKTTNILKHFPRICSSGKTFLILKPNFIILYFSLKNWFNSNKTKKWDIREKLGKTLKLLKILFKGEFGTFQGLFCAFCLHLSFFGFLLFRVEVSLFSIFHYLRAKILYILSIWQKYFLHYLSFISNTF